MGNEVGGNDLGHEVSLVTSNESDKGNTTRNVGTQKFINIFQLFQESEQNVGKKHFGKLPAHLSACDAESVCTARSQNMS